ncbi:toxic anion resistance protein [Pedococcus sp. KACC 23699]|uniref:Toxic anion resistance protein n=1 Tax=Pedococcus sp. KACC 23699 TaxID=3149228 RepID=A0AAU7JX55_9MICO
MTDLNLDLANFSVPASGTAQAEAPFVMDTPAPVQVVTQAKAQEMVPVRPETKTALEQKADQWVVSLTAVDPKSPEFGKALESISKMGDSDIRRSSEVSNRMLQRSSSQMDKASPQYQVGMTLTTLRGVVTDLDPNRADLTGARKVLKFMPGGNKIDAYFQKYRSAESQLNDIVKALHSGQDELRKDNAAIQSEQANMWTAMEKMKEYNLLAEALDKAVVQKVEDLNMSGRTEDAQAIESDLLFAVRQRRQDIMTQMAVAVQGYMALGLIHKNNQELIRGVDRAQTTTLAALRTAIIVSQALSQQKLVLDQINAVNETTSDLILRTSEQLKQQSVDIHKQAASSMVKVEALKQAFTNVFETMDAIDAFRVQANDAMAQTIDALGGELDRAQSHLQRARNSQTSQQSIGF